MKQRSVLASFLILVLFSSTLVLGNTIVTSQRYVEPVTFSSRLKDQSTENLETLTQKLDTVGTEIKTEATDPASPEVKTGDNITVNYKGWLAETGVIFDQSFARGDSGYTFTVGEGVIAGWSIGVVGMRAGEIRRLKIPSSLGYGETGSGDIPPNADLMFDVELLKIN